MKMQLCLLALLKYTTSGNNSDFSDKVKSASVFILYSVCGSVNLWYLKFNVSSELLLSIWRLYQLTAPG
jgi:hypothetical protein